MYALVDGNSFYASCERVYRPDLRDTPIVVLSNNDGCVITRSSQAKALGIKMGEPMHKIRNTVNRYGVEVFSSNYELYGDMSRRMMQSIASLVPRIEVYSIDECFADVAGMERIANLTELGREIRARVLQWVGIPTCVGIAPTKTLAKFCNHLAKRHATFKGVVNWNDWNESIRTRALNSQPVGEVWGIGRRLTEQLNAMGIHTVGDLQRAPSAQIRKLFGVVVERTQRELSGIACIELEHAPADKKQLIRSRSFGKPITDIADIQSALAHHATEAGRDLRRQQSVTHQVGIILQTNPFNPNDPQYYVNESICISAGTADTRLINKTAQAILERSFKAGYKYKKCGIVVTGIESINAPQQLDWLNPSDSEQSMMLMQCVDELNARFGKGSMRLGIERLSSNWKMRREKLSPCYTGRFGELLRVR